MQCFEFGSVTVCCVVSAVNKATWNAKDEFLAFPYEQQQKNNSNQWEFFL